MNYLWPLIYLTGLLISIQGWRWSKKKAYWLLFTYFILGLYSVTGAPHVNAWIDHRFGEKPNPTVTAKKIEMQKEIGKLYEKYELPGEALKSNISIPLGQLLLVIALWMIIRRERNTEPPASPRTRSPERQGEP